METGSQKFKITLSYVVNSGQARPYETVSYKQTFIERNKKILKIIGHEAKLHVQGITMN